MKAAGQPLNAKSEPTGNLHAPRLSWDIGTAYDLFVSLAVLHEPDRFGLRGSWAAGVRSRFPPDERKLLEEMHGIIWVPMNGSPACPSDHRHLGVAQIPPGERLPTLT
jgi:hypothetical protein